MGTRVSAVWAGKIVNLESPHQGGVALNEISAWYFTFHITLYFSLT